MTQEKQLVNIIGQAQTNPTLAVVKVSMCPPYRKSGACNYNITKQFRLIHTQWCIATQGYLMTEGVTENQAEKASDVQKPKQMRPGKKR